MAYYLIQAAYNPEAWDALVKNPQNREDAIRPGVEALGGRVHGLWFAFGEYDIVGIFELPDNISAAAFSFAASSSRAVKALKTTPLMTMEEGIEGMRKAPGSGYQPPS